MRIFLLGASGMLGTDLESEFQDRNWSVESPGPDKFDIGSAESAATLIVREPGSFDWVINAAAYTAVDAAESNLDECFLVNAVGPGYLAKAATFIGARTLHFSTDYVFDGGKTSPYTEDDAPMAKGVYARSKLAGESAVSEADPGAIIVRTAWLYGIHGKSFPRTMIEAWQAGKSLKVVNDQVGTPTSTVELARVVGDLMERELDSGVFHAAGGEVATWFEFAELALQIAQRAGLKGPEVDLLPISTEEWPTAAVRPPNSALSSEKLWQTGVEPMRPLEEALEAFVALMTPG
jgi:dTDP-4-dehydrorhamnose reductase